VLGVTAPLTLKFSFLAGFADAVRHIGDVRHRRRRERAAARRSDREVLEVFEGMARAGGVHVYDDAREIAGEPDRPEQ
jgi:hypothetical protein